MLLSNVCQANFVGRALLMRLSASGKFSVKEAGLTCRSSFRSTAHALKNYRTTRCRIRTVARPLSPSCPSLPTDGLADGRNPKFQSSTCFCSLFTLIRSSLIILWDGRETQISNLSISGRRTYRDTTINAPVSEAARAERDARNACRRFVLPNFRGETEKISNPYALSGSACVDRLCR